MKIAFLHLTMGIVKRGSEVVVHEIATALAKNHEVLVIQSGKKSKSTYQVKRAYPLERAPATSPNNLFSKVLFRLGLDEQSRAVKKFTASALPELKNFNPDVVIAVNGAPQLKVLRRLSFRPKVVTFGHAGIGHHDQKTLAQNPDLFIALSQAARAWAESLASRTTKVIYIPNPVLKPKSTSKIKLTLSKPIVLTVSALSKYKNIPSIIEAVKELPVSYHLIGSGEEEARVLKELNEYPGEFSWVREVDHQEIYSYYSEASVFCFVPDKQEAFGRVYLEAMLAGLPIVASDDPIRREIIGPRGIYVDPHDPPAIRDGIKRALELGKVSYTKELKKYELRAIIKKLEKEFHDLTS